MPCRAVPCQTNGVNYTSVVWLDTARGVSRQDAINYDDSSPQLSTSLYFCAVRWHWQCMYTLRVRARAGTAP